MLQLSALIISSIVSSDFTKLREDGNSNFMRHVNLVERVIFALVADSSKFAIWRPDRAATKKSLCMFEPNFPQDVEQNCQSFFSLSQWSHPLPKDILSWANVCLDFFGLTLDLGLFGHRLRVKRRNTGGVGGWSALLKEWSAATSKRRHSTNEASFNVTMRRSTPSTSRNVVPMKDGCRRNQGTPTCLLN